jgi:hypothetical protein
MVHDTTNGMSVDLVSPLPPPLLLLLLLPYFPPAAGCTCRGGGDL